MRRAIFVAALAVLAAACQLVLGIEDRTAAVDDPVDAADARPVDAAQPGDASAPDALDGGATCEAGLTACGARCVHLATDTSACGACDHSCLDDAGCRDGYCAVRVPVTISGVASYGHFAANPSFFAMSVSTGLALYDRAGNTLSQKTYIRADSDQDRIAANGVAVYGSRRSATTPGVVRVAFAEEISKVVAVGGSGAPLFLGLRLLGDRAYFVAGDDLHGAIDGSTSFVLTTVPGLTTAIAADGDDVFAGDAAGMIYRVPKNGGDATPIVMGPPEPVVADAWKGQGKIVWATRTNVLLVDTTTGDKTVIHAGAFYLTDVRVAADGYAYVLDRGVESGATGRLVRVGLTAPYPTLPLMDGISSPRDLYVEGAYAFTLDRDTASPVTSRTIRVLRIAR